MVNDDQQDPEEPRTVIDALDDIRSTLYWIAFWLFCIAFFHL